MLYVNCFIGSHHHYTHEELLDSSTTPEPKLYSLLLALPFSMFFNPETKSHQIKHKCPH